MFGNGLRKTSKTSLNLVEKTLGNKLSIFQYFLNDKTTDFIINQKTVLGWEET